MHIEDGTNVDPTWVNTLLIGDGTTWYTRLTNAQVVSITQVFIAVSASGVRDSITKVRFHLANGRDFDVELQDVSNQNSWNDGTQAAINTAMGDLNTILAI